MSGIRLSGWPARCSLLIGLWLVLPALGQEVAPRRLAAIEDYWAKRKPNVIWLVANGIRPGELGCYGAHPSLTPNLDTMASEGMCFTQFYAGSPHNAAARATLLTGRHTGHLTLPGSADVALDSNRITVAEMLKPAEYVTGALGVWGLGAPNSPQIPTQQGFDEWLGYLSFKHAEDHYPTQLWRNAQLLPREKNYYDYRGEYAPDLLTRAGINFVRMNKLRPFFLYFAYTHPCAPVKNGAPADRDRAAMLQRLDTDIGQILGAVSSIQMETNTLVLFTSVCDGTAIDPVGHDPKPMANAMREPNGRLKDQTLRVPLIARWTDRIPAGSVNAEPWAFWDLLPTVAELAGVPPPRGLDGISLLPTLKGQTQTNRHEVLYWECHENPAKQAVRVEDWKVLRTEPGAALQLYNLKSDPRETNNLAGQRPELLENLAARLQAEQTHAPPAGRAKN